MWKKNTIWVLGLIFLLVSPVLAFDLTLTKIGTMSTIGADYSLVSYVGAIPTLEGTATPAATVSIKINTTSVATMAATVSGVWNLLPATLNTGDNTIVITSGTQSLNFVLRYNSGVTPTPTATSSAGVTALPATGTWEYITLGLGGGLGIWFLGREAKKRMKFWETGVK